MFAGTSALRRVHQIMSHISCDRKSFTNHVNNAIPHKKKGYSFLHVNNVVYYSYFDTLVNQFMIEKANFDIHHDEIIGVVVETQCQYHKSIAFPDKIEGALRVAKLGKSSVKYEIGIFKNGEDEAVASGYFVHVFVQRKNNKPTLIPEKIRNALETL